MRFLKFLGITVAILAIGLVFIVNFGVKKSNFSCSGIETIDGHDNPTQFSLRFERLRWFVFWADDDGTTWLETEKGRLHIFLFFEASGPIWHFANEQMFSPPFGRYSTISNKAMIGIADSYVIEGECSPEPDYS